MSLIVGWRNLRSREVKWFTQSHTRRAWNEPRSPDFCAGHCFSTSCPQTLTGIVIELGPTAHSSLTLLAKHTHADRKEIASNQDASNLGGWWSWHPPSPPPMILLDHECFKGKKRRHLSESWRWGVRVVSSPAGCRLLCCPSWYYLVHTVWSHGLFVCLLKGKAWGTWLKVSDNIALLKWQDGFPAEDSFLQRADFKSPLVRTSFYFYGIGGRGPPSVTVSCWHRMPYSQNRRCQHGSVASLSWHF